MTDQHKRWERVSDNLYYHIKTKTYYVRKFRAGKGRLFKSTGESRKGQAQSKANEMVAEWLYGKNPLTKYALVSEVCDKLRSALEEDFHDKKRGEKTWEHDRVYIKQLRELFGHLLINEIDETYWMDWVRTHGRKSGKTMGGLAKYMSKVLTYAHSQKLIDRKPRIKNPDKRSGDVSTYTVKQIQALMAAATPDMRDLIILGAECGMRPYEARRLQWDMVLLPKPLTIQLPDWFTKTRTYREFIAGPMSAEMLKRRFKTRTSKFIFPSGTDAKKPVNEMTFSKHWRATVKKAKLPLGSKFHWLRHTFFTRALLEAGKPLPMVAAYGGNSAKILFDRYLSKQASRTSDIAGSVRLDEEE